ncbi:tryptophanyl-tRNA synthetase, mitochondrial [Megalopta genalis]|uniref:tryptophanyl-tRNA synthetase, mitochondrial n=1 Tax=Megalopta genalis TaxID=115081 RepID=UPI003FCFA67D
MLTLLKNTVASQTRCVICKCMCRRQYSSGKGSKLNYPRRIFSGIQPTGDIHIGNYLGAIKKWVELQYNEKNVIWSVVDMHAITLPQDRKELHNNIMRMTATLLACGIDPKKSILFQQSAVPMHAELYWVLGCITTLARLAHLPQFKEKSQTVKFVPLGLYVYPVLQAADILLYRATHVPCGEDQIQHIELAQELAVSFNNKIGKIFCVPHALINEDASHRIRSLRDPMKKMSKSDQSPKSRINILDEPSILKEKVKKAVTDFTSEITYEPNERPGVANLITIHSMFTGQTSDEICLEMQGLNTAQYKLLLADLIIEKLSPIREEFSRLIKEPVYLSEVLKDGKERATEIAEETWQQVRDKVGFGDGNFQHNENQTVQNTIYKI